MTDASFVAYIDESGDTGFSFRPGGKGSSEWLILSAIVVHKAYDHAMVTEVKAIKSALSKKPDAVLHFADCKNHEHKVMICERMAKIKMRAFSMLAHKPSLALGDQKEHGDVLYRYLCRLLLERISWYCRDYRQPGKGNGTAELLFSNRTRMSYSDLTVYARYLRDVEDTRIHWAALDAANVKAVPAPEKAGLQVADFVASATYKAVTRNAWGHVEPRYLQMMKECFYRRGGKILSYGVKCYPDLEKIKPSNPEVSIFEGF